jgi:hypothetical protein
MRNLFFLKIIIFILLSFYGSAGTAPFLYKAEAKGVKTSYKRYSIFKYRNENILCESYIVKKDDWLYKIFRKKGEISEKDFPRFLIIFKRINPQISNIDDIEPGNSILIPLKSVKKEDYNQNISGKVDVPVVEFSARPDNDDLKRFTKKHTMKKGESISTLVDKAFLKKGGTLSEDGLKAFELANPDIKNIHLVYEGADIYLPDPSITSQSWFQSRLSGKTQHQETGKNQPRFKSFKINEHQLIQLQKYASLIGGTLLNQGKIYFPGKNTSHQVLDLSIMPIIETNKGSKILILSDETMNAAILKKVKAYWKNLKIQLMSDIMDKQPTAAGMSPLKKRNVTTEYKQLIQVLLSQTDHDYVPHAKIPFSINHIHLEASFGRVIRKEAADILINFGNVYGSALGVLEKKEFEIISIPPKFTAPELVRTLFSHLGYSIWENPSFLTDDTVENMTGLYAAKAQNKLFIPMEPLSPAAIQYLKKEGINILSTKETPPVQ